MLIGPKRPNEPWAEILPSGHEPQVGTEEVANSLLQPIGWLTGSVIRGPEGDAFSCVLGPRCFSEIQENSAVNPGGGAIDGGGHRSGLQTGVRAEACRPRSSGLREARA